MGWCFVSRETKFNDCAYKVFHVKHCLLCKYIIVSRETKK